MRLLPSDSEVRSPSIQTEEAKMTGRGKNTLCQDRCRRRSPVSENARQIGRKRLKIGLVMCPNDANADLKNRREFP